MFDIHEELEHVREEGLVTEFVRPIRSGKEASVFLCRSEPAFSGAELVVAKRYHDRHQRNFRNDDVYVEGRVMLDERADRALQKKTGFGRAVQQGWWIATEYETLTALHGAGVAVPRPIALDGSLILMEYVGDEEEAAPQLRNVRPDEDEAPELFEQVLRNVQLALVQNVVHADLSPFNILYWDGALTIIDLPQAVDARFNPNARDLLTRDLRNVCTYFARFGVDRDPEELAADLWTEWEFADLVPADLRLDDLTT